MRPLRSALLLLVALGSALGLFRPRPDEAADRDRAGRRKRWLADKARTIVAFLVVSGLAGFLVLLSGIVPNRASSRHWPVTRWFLELATRRTVATHSLGLEAPPLDDPALVLKGAGHFEIGCKPCHGSPGLRQPRIAQAMTARPPYLPPELAKWSPEELFYLVKHGIKFTGMPAWPALERDDEVWAVVAFLLVLPGLDEAAYRRLAYGDEATGGQAAPLDELTAGGGPSAVVRDSCARCHGVDGLGRGTGAFPRLAGQRAAYLRASLEAYTSGRRHSGVMEPIAAGLDDAQLELVVRHYASRPPPPPLDPGDAAAVARGEAIARDGIPGLGVPSCADCHGPFPLRRNQHYPRLAGQYADYLVLQLELFQAGRRGGTPYAHLMQRVAKRLDPEQVRDLALYYASLAAD